MKKPSDMTTAEMRGALLLLRERALAGLATAANVQRAQELNQELLRRILAKLTA